MNVLLAFAALAGQAVTPQEAPTLPNGTSPEFARLATDIEAKLVAGDVEAARTLAKQLPVANPKINWVGVELLPEKLRKKFSELEALAPKFWAIPGSSSESIQIGFKPVLPIGPEKIPMATVIDRTYPFEATIGLTRGIPAEETNENELRMELAYTLGRYYGVAESQFPSTCMFRNAHPGLLTFGPLARERRVAAGNVLFADRLREAVAAGKPLGLKAPVAEIVTKELELGQVGQGTVIRSTFLVKNTGVGTLHYNLVPDCGCFRIPQLKPIEPGQEAKFVIGVETREFVGEQHKRLLLTSNDPAQPTQEVKVTFKSIPAYRLLRPGSDVVIVGDEPTAYDFFMFVPPDSPIHPISANWEGMEASVTVSPWKGPLADPDMNEGALSREGWRFRVRLKENVLAGRTPGTLVVETDSPLYPVLRANLAFQRGIASLPESLYIGQLRQEVRISYLISRPGKPFKVTGVDAGLFKSKVIPLRNGSEYRIDLTYEGGGSKGDFLYAVKVKTDDPKQPVIETLVSGIVP